MIGKTQHAIAMREFVSHLIAEGHTVVAEVGLPYGRLDVATIDAEQRYEVLYEIKTTAPHGAISQLLGYAAFVEGDPDLVIVIPPELESQRLREEANDEGIELLVFEFGWRDEACASGPGKFVETPHFHPVVADRMRRAVLMRESDEGELAA